MWSRARRLHTPGTESANLFVFSVLFLIFLFFYQSSMRKIQLATRGKSVRLDEFVKDVSFTPRVQSGFTFFHFTCFHGISVGVVCNGHVKQQWKTRLCQFAREICSFLRSQGYTNQLVKPLTFRVNIGDEKFDLVMMSMTTAVSQSVTGCAAGSIHR